LLTHPLFLLKAIFSNLSRTKIVQAGRIKPMPLKITAGGQAGRIKPMPLKITAGRPLKITASRQAAQKPCRQAGELKKPISEYLHRNCIIPRKFIVFTEEICQLRCV
jgi:hypothetical protein